MLLDIIKRLHTVGLDEKDSTTTEEDEEDEEPTSSLGFLGEISIKDAEMMSNEELMARIGTDLLSCLSSPASAKCKPSLPQEWCPWWNNSNTADFDLNLNSIEFSDLVFEKHPHSARTTHDWPFTSSHINKRTEIDIEENFEGSVQEKLDVQWFDILEITYFYVVHARKYEQRLFNSMEIVAEALCHSSRALSYSYEFYKSPSSALSYAESMNFLVSEEFVSTQTIRLYRKDVLQIFSDPKNVLRVLIDVRQILQSKNESNSIEKRDILDSDEQFDSRILHSNLGDSNLPIHSFGTAKYESEIGDFFNEEDSTKSQFLTPPSLSSFANVSIDRFIYRLKLLISNSPHLVSLDDGIKNIIEYIKTRLDEDSRNEVSGLDVEPDPSTLPIFEVNTTLQDDDCLSPEYTVHR